MKDISLIIARILLGVAKKDEKDELSKWKETSEDKASFVKAIQTYWTSSPNKSELTSSVNAKDRLFARLQAENKERTFYPNISILWRVAAVIIFTISIAAISIFIASETNLFFNKNWVEVSTEAGQQSKVTLPDGTLVWLNSETSLKYHPKGKNRKVDLKGEAYFEVTHSDKHPFILKAGNSEVKVLGTKFNVAYYPGSNSIEASLLSGKIVFSVDNNNKEIELLPGEKVVYNEIKHLTIKSTAKVQNEILWRQGVLVFDNDLFPELIQKLERYYAVRFVYDKGKFEDIHYTGSLDNLSIQKVLEIINLTIPVKYEIENKTIKLDLKK